MTPVEKSLAFLNDILQRSDNLIFFLVPVREENKIIDFKIDFLTENIESFTSQKSDRLIDQNLKSIYPNIYDDGIFEILTACFSKNDFAISFDRIFNFCGNKVWFQCQAKRYLEGITVSCKDISKLKITEQKLRDSNKQLEFQNTILNEAEMISKSASFRWNISTDTWIISENIKNLFYSDIFQSLQDDFTLFDLMIQEDAARIKLEIDNSKYDDELSTQYFTVDSGSSIKHYSLTGNFVPVSDGQMLLGVVKDITSILLNEKKLLNKNEELIRSNAELDSFNHIASHDLQEPLRKIRMFISRVKDLDNDALSEKAKTFLNKIESSSERMQELIRHLLTYSRIGKVGITFEEVHLQEIIDTISQELSDPSSEKHTIIQHTPLPSIFGVSYLIHQLFFNIISNAIKYKHPERPLILEISSKRKFANTYGHETPEAALTETDEFVEVSFKDNGIGFKQEYANQIFELFKRLHQKNEYTGTGIGLAICKKIAETHNGSIIAKGEPGIGSEFLVSFPISKY